jgi:hypothetical protein
MLKNAKSMLPQPEPQALAKSIGHTTFHRTCKEEQAVFGQVHQYDLVGIREDQKDHLNDDATFGKIDS